MLYPAPTGLIISSDFWGSYTGFFEHSKLAVFRTGGYFFIYESLNFKFCLDSCAISYMFLVQYILTYGLQVLFGIHRLLNIFYMNVYTFHFSYKTCLGWLSKINGFCKIVYLFVVHKILLIILLKSHWRMLFQKKIKFRLLNCSIFGITFVFIRRCRFLILGSVKSWL